MKLYDVMKITKKGLKNNAFMKDAIENFDCGPLFDYLEKNRPNFQEKFKFEYVWYIPF